MAAGESEDRRLSERFDDVFPHPFEGDSGRALFLFLPIGDRSDDESGRLLQNSGEEQLHEVTVNPIRRFIHVLQQHDSSREVRLVRSADGSRQKRKAAAGHPCLYLASNQWGYAPFTGSNRSYRLLR